MSRNERLLIAVCLVAVAAGLALRIQHLGFPDRLSFDERHFVVKGARNFLQHKADTNEHPPLGKLLIAGSIAAFGDQPWVWRLPSLVAGIVNIALAAAIAHRLFRGAEAAALAAMFLAVDGFFVTYSRTACLDSGLVAFMLASAFFLLRARGASDLALAALFAGLCMSVKFTGVVLIVALVLSCIVHRDRLPGWTLASLALMPVVYVAVYDLGLSISHRPLHPIDETFRLFRIQVGMTDWLNPWASHWTTWFVPLRPMPLVFMKVEKHVVRVMTSLPNLAILWTSSVLGVVSFCRIATLGPRRFLARLDGSGFFAGEDLKAVGWLTLLWILPLVPWMVTYRDSYFNHYLPSYVFAVILLAGGASRLVRARPVLGWVFIAIVLAVFVAYAPVWGELPIRRRTWRALMFLGSWR